MKLILKITDPAEIAFIATALSRIPVSPEPAEVSQQEDAALFLEEMPNKEKERTALPDSVETENHGSAPSAASLRKLVAEKIQEGKKREIKKLLSEYGVSFTDELDEKFYRQFSTKLQPL